MDPIRRGHSGQTRPLPCTIRSVQCTSDANGEPDVGSGCKRRAASPPCKPCVHDSTSPSASTAVEIWAKDAQYSIPAGWTKLRRMDDVVGEQQRPEPGPGVASGSVQLTIANFSRFRHLILSHAVKFVARSRDPFTAPPAERVGWGHI